MQTVCLNWSANGDGVSSTFPVKLLSLYKSNYFAPFCEILTTAVLLTRGFEQNTLTLFILVKNYLLSMLRRIQINSFFPVFNFNCSKVTEMLFLKIYIL